MHTALATVLLLAGFTTAAPQAFGFSAGNETLLTYKGFAKSPRTDNRVAKRAGVQYGECTASYSYQRKLMGIQSASMLQDSILDVEQT
jgi:hypothetical protein